MISAKTAELIDAHVAWLETYPWQWFCTLTFRGFASAHRANRCFQTWISELRDAEGTRSFAWFRITETGATGEDLHFHALIGGLRYSHAEIRAVWMRRWDEIGGSALIDRYRRGIGGPRYILKSLNPNDDSQIAFEIPTQVSPKSGELAARKMQTVKGRNRSQLSRCRRPSAYKAGTQDA